VEHGTDMDWREEECVTSKPETLESGARQVLSVKVVVYRGIADNLQQTNFNVALT
jgi:hypothetical protein